MFMTIAELNKKFHKAYTLGLTTNPDPSTLKEVTEDMWKGIDYKKGIDPAMDTMDANRATIRGWNDAAKKNKTLIGRTIAEGMGDGYGIYVVIKENKKTLKLQVCINIGDDWMPWGESATIGKAEALQFYLKESKLFGCDEA